MSGRVEISKVAEEDDILKLMEGIVDEEFIRNETGVEDLTSMVHLTLTLDTSIQSIYDLHHILPNLLHLVLDNSIISSVRDLGIGLRSLKSLSLASCGLYDLDGIGVLTGLQELYLRDNHISDVTPLAMHENLEALNLSENRIADISIADSLSSCLNLRALFLTRNPLANARNYRLIVATLIPNLQMLDGTPVDPHAGRKVTNGMILESAAEMKMAEEDLDDELRLENEIMGMTLTADAADRESTRPLQPKVAATTLGSDTTMVLAGSMAAAVRKRRQLAVDAALPDDSFDQLLEYESTLDILDAALKPSNHSKDNETNNTSQTGSRRNTPRAQVEVEEDAPYDAFSPQLRRRDSKRMEKELLDGVNSPVLRPNQKSAAGQRGGSIAMSMSFDADVASSQQRPRTAAQRMLSGLPSPIPTASSPRQRNSSRPQSAISVGSPKQQQHHHSDDSGTQAAPFKVAVDKQQRRADDLPTRVDANLPAKPSVPGSSLVHLDIVRRAPAVGYMIAEEEAAAAAAQPALQLHGQGHSQVFPGSMDDEEDSDGAEDIAVTHAARHRLMAVSSVSASANSVTSNLKSRQQILQLLKSTADKSNSDKGGDEGNHSPDEHGHDENGDTQDLLEHAKYQEQATATRFDIVGIAARGDNTSRGSSRRGSRGECVLESLEYSPHRPPPAARAKVGDARAAKDTMSSKAGISLGFNLAGSLAAIDKWVQDMNSEGEDSSVNNSDNEQAGSSDDDDDDNYARNNTSSSGSLARKKSLLFALSLPADKNKGTDGSGKQADVELQGNPSNLDGNSKDSFSEYSAGSSTARQKNKILSRDAILSMCTGAGRDSARNGADSDEDDSDLDIPDLRLRSASNHHHRGAHTGSESSRPNSCSPAAPVRKRDADVRNRLKRGASGTPRSTARQADDDQRPAPALFGAQPVVVVAAEVNVETPLVVEPRARPKRAVPDFPMEMNAINNNRAIDENANPRAAATLHPDAGPAVAMTDTELVHLLRQQPKHTEQLRTKNNFQAFFKKIDEQRMRSLLMRAYADISENAERIEKVDKRMHLLDGFLS